MTKFTPLDWAENIDYNEQIRNRYKKITLTIDANDRRPIWEQLCSTVGWKPIPPNESFSLNADETLTYPGLPPTLPILRAQHGLERIYVYPAGFVIILQLSGSYSMCKYET